MVSICYYIHSGMEIIFNFVMLAFLIAQAAGESQDMPKLAEAKTDYLN